MLFSATQRSSDLVGKHLRVWVPGAGDEGDFLLAAWGSAMISACLRNGQ